MKLLLAVLCVAVAGLVAVALRAEPAPVTVTQEQPTPAPSQPAALFFGDSYFTGSQYTDRLESMAYLAGTAMGYQTMVGGAGGTGFVHARPTTGGQPGAGDYARQMELGALQTVYPPELVVIQGGINDRGEDGVQAAAVRVLTTVQRTFPGVPVVLVGPVNLAGSRPVAEALQDAAAARDVPFIDARRWSLRGVLGPDGVHPTKKGARTLARRLVADLRRIGVAQAGAGSPAR